MSDSGTYLILVRFTRSVPEDIDAGRRTAHDVEVVSPRWTATHPRSCRPALTDGAAMLATFLKELQSGYLEYPGRMHGAWEVVPPTATTKVAARFRNIHGRWLDCHVPQQGSNPAVHMRPHYTVLVLFQRDTANDLDIARERHPNNTPDCALLMQFADELNVGFTTGYEAMVGSWTLLKVDAPIPVCQEDVNVVGPEGFGAGRDITDARLQLRGIQRGTPRRLDGAHLRNWTLHGTED
jgi:hypothetical protein